MKRGSHAVLALLALVCSATEALAQSWSGPDPSRRPQRLGQGDLDFALSELCFPFLIQNAAVDALVARQGVLPVRNQPDWAPDGRAFFVGQADVIVSLREKANGRECTVRVRDGNEERYQETLRARLATWPVPLTRAAREIAPNAYISRETFCGPPEGPQDWAVISVGGENGTPSVMATLGRSQTRGDGCDAAPALAAAPETSRADSFEAAMRVCLAVLDGARVDDAAQRFGVTLDPAQRLGDAVRLRAQGALGDFFGADAQVRMTPRGVAPMLVVDVAGTRCNVATPGADDYGSRLTALLGPAANVAPDAERSFPGPNGSLVRVLRTGGARPGVVVFLSRAGA